MEDRYLIFLEIATQEELEEIISALEEEEDRDLEDVILFFASFLI